VEAEVALGDAMPDVVAAHAVRIFRFVHRLTGDAEVIRVAGIVETCQDAGVGVVRIDVAAVETELQVVDRPPLHLQVQTGRILAGVADLVGGHAQTAGGRDHDKGLLVGVAIVVNRRVDQQMLIEKGALDADFGIPAIFWRELRTRFGSVVAARLLAPGQ
jgi:hypothetical protein